MEEVKHVEEAGSQNGRFMEVIRRDFPVLGGRLILEWNAE